MCAHMVCAWERVVTTQVRLARYRAPLLVTYETRVESEVATSEAPIGPAGPCLDGGHYR